MRRIVSETMVASLILCVVTLGLGSIQPVGAETITVPDDYSTIQEAINAAKPADTIYVKAGTYYEHVVVNQVVRLVGEDTENTIIDGNHTGTVVSVTADNVAISNFTIRNSGDEGGGVFLCSSNNTITGNNIISNGFGIDLLNSSYNTISRSVISNNEWGAGVFLLQSSYNHIGGNNVTSNAEGICLAQNSSNNMLTENNVADNSWPLDWGPGGTGISISGSSNNVLRENIMVGNFINFEVGYETLLHFVNNVDSSNTINGKPVYIWVNKHNVSVPLDAGYVALVNCTNIKVENLTLHTCSDRGILLANTHNSTITGNDISASEAYYWFVGLELFNSSSNIIAGNNIHWNRIGIQLTGSSNNTLIGNTVAYNIDTYRYQDGHGIILSDSSNNTIYHNNFVDNLEQFSIADSVNIWNHGSEGNYWSSEGPCSPSYSQLYGVDEDHDGIGDIPYELDSHNTDNYPLMGMFSDFHVLQYQVQTICNSTISDFQFNGTAICFNVTVYSAYGWPSQSLHCFCRICIPTALMNNGCRVSVNGTEVRHNLLPRSNSTHSYLYFTYNCSTEGNQVVTILGLPSILDLNNDGIVNIQDLFIVAKVYGSHGPDIPNPGDPASEKWNEIADVTKDGWINLRDLYEVAKDYGKTI